MSAYEDIPELTPDDVQDGWGFGEEISSFDYMEYFLEKIAAVLQNPSWIADWRETVADSQGFPVYCQEQQRSFEFLEGWFANPFPERYDEERLMDCAKRVNRRELFPPHAHEGIFTGRIVVTEAFSRMNEEHTNYSMFRGARYTGEYLKYVGVDFSPRSLSGVLRHDTFAQYGGDLRDNPVLAVLPVEHLVSCCMRSMTYIETEGHWWSDSLEVHSIHPEFRAGVTIYRPPSSEAAMEQVIDAYERKAISNLK
ncbi:MAG: hypothetical protein OXR66_00770 [Candidatus Woesearchaeota archaeon]|nr:hypothetical protein [Candidatus Woesearchaeota archaeon]